MTDRSHMYNEELRVEIAKVKGFDHVAKCSLPSHEWYGKVIGYDHTDCKGKIVPDWTGDMNAAMELLEEMPMPELHRRECVWTSAHHWCLRPDEKSKDECPKRAICLAYLAWCDAKKEAV